MHFCGYSNTQLQGCFNPLTPRSNQNGIFPLTFNSSQRRKMFEIRAYIRKGRLFDLTTNSQNWSHKKCMANSEENLNFHCRSWEWKRWRFVDLSYEYLSHFQVPLYFLSAKEKSTLSLVSLHLTYIIVIKSTCGNPFKLVLSVWF